MPWIFEYERTGEMVSVNRVLDQVKGQVIQSVQRKACV